MFTRAVVHLRRGVDRSSRGEEKRRGSRSNPMKKQLKKKKKPKTTTEVRVSQSARAQPFIQKVQSIADELELGATLDPEEVKALTVTVSNTPAKLIELMATAKDTFGALIGTEFDSDNARETAAFASSFGPVVSTLVSTGARLDHDILLKRANVALATRASYVALKGVVRTPAGAPLKEMFKLMKQVMRDHRRGNANANVPAPPATPAEPTDKTATEEAKDVAPPKKK
jgi:hypothetical protein